MTVLRTTGKLLISIGVGVLLFVAWVLWGTGIYTSRQQHRLEVEFAAAPRIEPERNPRTGFGGPGDGFTPESGEPVFALRIPAIGLNDIVVQGVGVEELKLGPGHYPDCRGEFNKPLCTNQEEVWPGEAGRVIVSGHRTTHGAPFWDLDRLERRDEIIIETQWGNFTYRVTNTRIVLPNSTDIANPDPDGSGAEIALTTCNPRFSAAERLIVFAEMRA
jgi:sortase A